MESSLRVLHVDTERTWRGGEQQAMYLAEGLASRGHHVALVGRTGGEFARRGRALGLETHELHLGGEINPMAIAGLARILRRDRFQIIHAHTSHAHTQALLASKLAAGVKCVVSRRVDFGLDRSPWKINRLKYRYGVDRYIAISQAVRQVLVRGGVSADRIAVVPSGIDLARLDDANPAPLLDEFRLDENTPVIGAVAHLAWHKGLELLVDAAPAILASVPSARFFLVGDGELRRELEERATRIAPGAFTFTGFRQDAPSWLALFDVVCAPSRMEGLNTTNLDALALKRPVVASRVGGIPEAVKHEETGLLIDDADVPGLAAAVVRLLRDRDLARRLGDNGRAWIEAHFTKERMTAGTEKVYQGLVGSAISTDDSVTAGTSRE